MAIAKDDILEAVSSMSVLELNELVKAFEEKFGVSAAAVAVAGPAGGGAGAARPRVRGRGGLRGSRQLRHQHHRRRPVRLPAVLA